MGSSQRDAAQLDMNIATGGTSGGGRSTEHYARSEALTMSLYVCLVLAAELVVLGESEGGKRAVVGALWGAAIGLTLAHIFAFHLANRAVGGGRLTPEEGLAIRLQLAAASGVAAVLSLPFLVLDTSAAITLAGYMAAGFVGTTSYVTARVAGAKQLRALLFGAVMLCIAVGVVLIKVALAPH